MYKAKLPKFTKNTTLIGVEYFIEGVKISKQNPHPRVNISWGLIGHHWLDSWSIIVGLTVGLRVGLSFLLWPKYKVSITAH